MYPGGSMLVHPRLATASSSQFGSECESSVYSRSIPGFGERSGTAIVYSRDTEIYGEGEPAEHFFVVVSGAVRTYKMLIDGRRQVCDFHLPGDVFGLETDETYTLSAEAIARTRLLVIKRRVVMANAERDRHAARQLLVMTGNELKRVQRHVLLLTKTAKERVAAFLLEMATRTGSPAQVDLPMSRQDIADYLGLTIETISRTLSSLEDNRIISIASSRQIVLRDIAALARVGG